MDTHDNSPDPGLDDALDDEIARTRPGFLVIGAAICTAITGLLLLLGALQLGAFLRLRGALTYAPHVMGGLGIVGFYVAAKIYGQRLWAVVLGLVEMTAVFFILGGFFVWLSSRGVFSLIMMLISPLALAAAIVDALAIGAVIRALRARRRLGDQGLDINF